ncbi:MAG: Prolipoprotein diacylglyceryl transferase [Alphaproteobacteria bacterium MarineAlpha8_Bin1]|nr:MAG: Prolipoprotein diacylglyceryl transferase [Alphaproteobacteria bacterium MarineAlpha8_Bin1]|tara:strand:- start:118 stop:885 length:768 start_codon:yes stop_codon:yes gene_type:complete
MVFFHNLNPIMLNLFGLNIYWYSLSYFCGFIFFIFYSKYLIKKKYFSINTNIIDDFLTYAIIGVILGGRLGYVFFYNFEFYISHPIEIFKIWRGGMSFHGGLLGVVISMFIFAPQKKEFLNLANLVSCSAPFGIFLGRIANFINGELIGKPTNSDWGVLYSFDDILRHPSQLYEATFEGLLIFGVLFFIVKKNIHFKFNLFSIFLILYSFFRFLIEFFREPDIQVGYIISNITMGQILCIPMLILGFLFLKYGKK